MIANVKDYGALGNGSGNDEPFIAAALTALSAVGGGVLYFPQGDYRVTARVLVAVSNLRIIGDGEGASICRIADTVTTGPICPMAIAGGASNIVVEGMELRGNGSSGGFFLGESLLLSNVSHVTLRDVTLRRGGTSNLTINQASDILVERVTAYDVNTGPAPSATAPDFVLYQGGISRVTFRDCAALSEHKVGGFHAITAADAMSIEDVEFDRCTVIGGNPSGTAHGFACKQDGGGGIIRNVTVRDSVVRDAGGMGVYCIGGAVANERLTVTNTLLDNCLTTGTSGTLLDAVIGVRGIHGATINGNTITNGGKDGNTCGIRIDGNGLDDYVTDVIVEGNEIRCGAHLAGGGIRVLDRSKRVDVLHNHVDLGGGASAVGVYFAAASGVHSFGRVLGNHVRNGGATSSGIRLDQFEDGVVDANETLAVKFGTLVTGGSARIRLGPNNRASGSVTADASVPVGVAINGPSVNRSAGSFTLVWGVDNEVQIVTSVAGGATISLSTSPTPPPGASFRLVCTAFGLGATLNVGGLKTVSGASFVEVMYSGSGWVLVGGGGL